MSSFPGDGILAGGRRVSRRAVLAAGMGLVATPPFAAAQIADAIPVAGEIDTLQAWLDAYGRPTAQVMLNGRGPFSFLVDTGSNTTVVASRVAVALGLAFTGRVNVNGTTGSAEFPVVTLDTLSAGIIAVDGLQAAVLENSAASDEDGILGGDVFAGRRLTFDISRGAVRVEPTQRTARSAPRRNMQVRRGLLAEIAGRVGNIQTRLLLDTGAEHCIANPALGSRIARSYPSHRTVENVQIRGVTGHALIGRLVDLPKIEFNEFEVTQVGAVVADAPIFRVWELEDQPAMIVGVNVMSRLASFTIDYGARRFDGVPMARLGPGPGVLRV